MTGPVVVDTNVILVADRAHEAASEECVIECIQRLQTLMANGTVVIDNGYRVLSEYQNKVNIGRGKGPGTQFVKWLLQHSQNAAKVQQVEINESAEEDFAEFPGTSLQPFFDAADRKFPAVANAHPSKPPIWQAADCKWLDWWQALADAGIAVVFLCPDDVCNYYRKKFPHRPEPKLP